MGSLQRMAMGCLAIALATAAEQSSVAKPHISLEQLESMFASMRRDAPWYHDGPLLWGYFFYSPNEAALLPAKPMLTRMGYRFVEIHRSDDGVFWLHVERVERHTAASLNAENATLYRFADAHPPIVYDGMDVGPVG